MRKADRNLETYLFKRVSDMMYQAHLDTVKLYFSKKKEDCDDKRARTIELTEEQYLTCKLDWCSKEVWTKLSHYWTTDEYKEKRMKAQAARLKSEDVAQNRGGSRPWGETQQLLVQNPCAFLIGEYICSSILVLSLSCSIAL